MPRAVLDTNVVLAAQRSTNPTSPNNEILDRWEQGDFTLLYSDDLVREYSEKLTEHGMEETKIFQFLLLLRFLGERIKIRFYHRRHYPIDPDDIAFVLCAWNGSATHLVSYDQHLLDVAPLYNSDFTICEPLAFLVAVRL